MWSGNELIVAVVLITFVVKFSCFLTPRLSDNILVRRTFEGSTLTITHIRIVSGNQNLYRAVIEARMMIMHLDMLQKFSIARHCLSATSLLVHLLPEIFRLVSVIYKIIPDNMMIRIASNMSNTIHMMHHIKSAMVLTCDTK